ncbi:MAG: SMC-Scp complex subunit ScpB [Oscillospiraceae bacterium]
MLKETYEKTLLALLFASGEPVSPQKLALSMEIDEALAENLTRRLAEKLEDEDFPLRILSLGNQFQLATAKEYTPTIKRLLNNRKNSPLTQAALEVLAAVAYNEPVTKAYIEQVRGVDSSSIVTSLVEQELLQEAGRLDLPGRPIAYRTTLNFLRIFGLNSLEDLPKPKEPSESAYPLDLLEGQLGFDGSEKA